MQNTEDSTKGAIRMSLDSDLGFWANIHAIGGFWVAFTGALVGDAVSKTEFDRLFETSRGSI